MRRRQQWSAWLPAGLVPWQEFSRMSIRRFRRRSFPSSTPTRRPRFWASCREELRPQILERLGTMTEVPAGLLEEVAQTLGMELPPAEAEAQVSVDGVSRSAALVRRLGRDAGEVLLSTLSEGNDELAAEIRRAMYSFEDLKAVDARGLRSVLEAVPSERLTLALKTASDSLREHIFAGMSKRAADRIREDMEILGGAKLSDVEAAQREIVEAALKLEAEGVISLEGNDGNVV